jgi:dienelactone hydrolase
MMKRWMILACCLMFTAVVHGARFAVEVETGSRIASGGEEVEYSLFIPQCEAGLPAPPWPSVVLNHGFVRSKKHHAATAYRLAQRGLIVLTPDQVGLGGIGSREANIAITLENLRWLRDRGRTPGDRLEGLVDPQRQALAGHSAGGALSLEATAWSQQTEHPVTALVLLDAVPWRSTISAARELDLPSIASFRSEPSSCNAQGSVREALRELPNAVEDILIVGATHCDPESPTDLGCRLVCDGSGALQRYLYRKLMLSFLQESLNMPAVDPLSVSYGRTVSWLEQQGLVVRETLD